MSNNIPILQTVYTIDTRTSSINAIICMDRYDSKQEATKAIAKTCIRVMKKTGSSYLDLFRSCKISSRKSVVF